MGDAKLPLSRHPFVRTDDIDEARQIYGRLNTPIRSDLLDRRTPFAWRCNAVRVGSILITASAYGGSSYSRTDSVQDIFSMTFALSSVGAEGFDGRTRVTVGAGHAAWLASPRSPSSFRYGTGYHGMNVTIPRRVMEDALGVLGGAPDRELLRFDSCVSLDSGAGAALERLVRFTADEADGEDLTLSSPLITARFIDSILFTMLFGQPNNHSSTLRTRPPAPGPRHVRRAAEYLAANADHPIRMRDLTQLTGVSARTLQLGFLKHRGCTPMAFLREQRLELARTKLLTRSYSNVTQIAHECGFEHAGRFSAQYRARFGETPSSTRAKAR